MRAFFERHRSYLDFLWNIWIPLVFLLSFSILTYGLFFHAYTLDWRMAFFHDIDAHGITRTFLDMVTERHYFNSRDPFTYYGMFFHYLSVIPLRMIEMVRGRLGLLDFFMAARWTCFLFAMGSLGLYFPLRQVFRLPGWFPYFAIFSTWTIPTFFYLSFFPKPETVQYFFVLVMLIYAKQFWDKGSFRFYLFACGALGMAIGAKWGCFLYLPFLMLVGIFSQVRHAPFSQWLGLLVNAMVRVALGVEVCVIVYLILNLRWLVDFHFSWQALLSMKHEWDTVLYSNLTFFDWLRTLLSFGYGTTLGFGVLVVWRIVQIVKSTSWRQELQFDDFLYAFVVFCLVFFAIFMNYAAAQQYLLFIVPILFIAVSRGLSVFTQFANRIFFRLEKPLVAILVTISLFTLVVLGDQNRWKSGFTVMQDFLHNEVSDRAAAGLYLLKRYPRSTSFFFYFNWWVPGVFEKTWNLRHCPFPAHRIAGTIKPDVVLLIEGVNAKCDPLIESFASPKIGYRNVARIPDDPQARAHYLVYERDGFMVGQP